MKTKFIYTLALLLFISCDSIDEETTNLCKVQNPIENLAWLKEIKKGMEKSATASRSSIVQYTYNNETIFVVNSCENCSNTISNVYSCSGTVICKLKEAEEKNTCLNFVKEATNKKILWQNHNQVIINEEIFNNTEAVNYEITDVTLSKDFLKVTINSSGCSGNTWVVNLISLLGILKSNPPQRLLKIALINQESCSTEITKSFTFNVKKLKRDHKTIVLNLEKWEKRIKY